MHYYFHLTPSFIHNDTKEATLNYSAVFGNMPLGFDGQLDRVYRSKLGKFRINGLDENCG